MHVLSSGHRLAAAYAHGEYLRALECIAADFEFHDATFAGGDAHALEALVVSYVYPLPLWLHDRNTWYKKGFGGWQLSGVPQIMTGLPMNLTIAPDRAGTGTTAGQRPEIIGDPFSGPGVGGRQFLNPKAFTIPAAGTFGNLGIYSLIGPAWNNWNAAVTKMFPMRERYHWDIRIEVFNFPNHLSYWGVNTGSINTAPPPNFGQVTSATDPRILQFSLRFSF